MYLKRLTHFQQTLNSTIPSPLLQPKHNSASQNVWKVRLLKPMPSHSNWLKMAMWSKRNKMRLMDQSNSMQSHTLLQVHILILYVKKLEQIPTSIMIQWTQLWLLTSQKTLKLVFWTLQLLCQLILNSTTLLLLLLRPSSTSLKLLQVVLLKMVSSLSNWKMPTELFFKRRLTMLVVWSPLTIWHSPMLKLVLTSTLLKKFVVQKLVCNMTRWKLQ